MAVAIDIHDTSAISPLDALWTLIQGQKKSVQKALAQRLNTILEAENEPKVKMTKEEFYAKLDRSIASANAGNTIAMRDDETGEEFINRLLAK